MRDLAGCWTLSDEGGARGVASDRPRDRTRRPALAMTPAPDGPLAVPGATRPDHHPATCGA
jgi:hypothetical protein